jgi:hypothetical protein
MVSPGLWSYLLGPGVRCDLVEETANPGGWIDRPKTIGPNGAATDGAEVGLAAVVGAKGQML